MEDLSPKISLDFRALFESLPGMFVVVLPDFAIAAASEDYLKGAMRTREEIAGRNVFEAFPENPAFAAGADGVNRLRASLEKVLATKKPDRMPTQRYDVRGHDAEHNGGAAGPPANGSFLEKHWEIYNKPVLDENGEVACILISVEDVTGREIDKKRAAEQRLVSDEMQREARAAQESLEHVLANVTDAFFRFDRELRYLYVNRATCEMFSISEDEFLGKSIDELFPDAPGNRFHAEARRALREQKTVVLENYYPPLDRWFENRIYPSEDGLSVFVTEITDRKRAEEKLRETSAVLNAVNLNTPTLIYVKDRESRIVSANPATCEVIGNPLSEIVGKSPGEYLRDEQVAERIRANDLRVIESGETITVEEEVVLRSGEQGVFLSTKTPYFDEGGEIVGLIGVSVDITDRKKAEHLIEASERKSREILESITEGFFALDADWRYTYVNPAAEKILSLSAAELLGKTIWEVYPGLTGSEFERVYRRAAAERVPLSLTDYYPDHERWYEVGVFPAERGGVTIFFRDVTQIKQTEASLREAQNRLETALGGARLGVWTYNAASGEFWADERARLMHGYDMQESLSFEKAGDHLQLDDRLRVQAALAASIAENLNLETEYLVVKGKNGEAGDGGSSSAPAVRWIASYAEFVPEKDAGERLSRNGGRQNGAPAGGMFYGIVHDVTERRTAEELLRRSEEKYRSLFNSVDSGFCIVELIFDEMNRPLDYRFVEINPAFAGQTGLVNAVGKTARELMPELENFWFETYGRIALTGEPERFTHHAEPLDRTYEVYALRVGRAEDRRVALLFNDITERLRAEEEIRRLNGRNSDILNSITDAFFSLDRSWRFTFINREAEKLLAPRARDLVGKNIWEEFPEAVGLRFYEHYRRAMETNETVAFEEYYPPPLDAWYEVRAYPSEAGLSVYFQNINKRKRREQELRESAEKLRLALESGGMGWWSFDPQTDASRPDEKCLELFGIEPANYRGSAAQLFETIHPEDRVRVRSEISRAIENRTIYQTEFRVLRPSDGETRWLAGIGKIVYDENSGEPLEMFGVNFDITERKLTEEILRRSEERFRGLQQATPDGFMIFESVRDSSGEIKDFRWVYVNPAAEKIVGRAGRDLIGKLLLEEMPGNLEAGLFDAYKTVVESGEIWRREFSYAHEGLDHYFLSTAVKTGDGFAVAFSDITSRRLAELEREELLAKEKTARERAEAATRAKDEFLAIVTHELRSPLNSIMGWSAMLKNQTTPEIISKVTEIIDRQGKLQLQLIEDLLDTARVTSGKMITEQKPVDLATVISAALDVVRPAAQSKGVALSMTIGSDRGIVTGDADRLQQIIWNLLSNAVKFTPAGGRVEIELRRENPYAAIIVSDTGQGIEPDFLPFVFDRFSQADTTKSRRFGGLGLGLSLVKQLTELHGGTVEVESAGHGKGSTFKVKLPIRAVSTGGGSGGEVSDFALNIDDVAGFTKSGEPSSLSGDAMMSNKGGRKLEKPLEPSDEKTSGALSGARILIADDLADARELVALTFRNQGAFVEAYASGGEALAALGENNEPVNQKFDLFVCDIGMPDEDGYSIIARLKQLEKERGGHLPAIALTAFSGSEDKKRALAAGFRVHISKPVEQRKLIETAASLLADSRTDKSGQKSPKG